MSGWKKLAGSSLVTEIVVTVLVLVARNLSKRIRP